MRHQTSRALLKRCLLNLLTMLLFTSVSCTLYADTHHNSSSEHVYNSARPDGHAPIGVMGDHTHHRGEIMFSYRFMHMSMSGLRSGTSSVAPQSLFDQYMMVPTDMDMNMHMFGFMYAPHDRLTLTLMIPYLDNSMDMLNAMGVRSSMNSDGIGDIQISGLVTLWENTNHHFHLNAGLSLPSGSIEETGTNPMGMEVLLPYPMQLGSGTWDILPGLTYSGHIAKWSWGFQALGTVRLDENSRQYRLGNRLMLTTWGARKINDWLSGSLRVKADMWGNISGSDPELNPMMTPAADPKMRGGNSLDLFLGLNFYVPRGFFRGHRIAIEGGLPVYQDLDGIQLERDWSLTVGWQYSL